MKSTLCCFNFNSDAILKRNTMSVDNTGIKILLIPYSPKDIVSFFIYTMIEVNDIVFLLFLRL